VRVSTLNNSAEFNIIPPDDFPAIATVNGEKPLLRLPKEDLLTAINRVAFSAATDDIKPVMTGIKLEIAKDTISFVGSDGFRLSRQSMTLLEPISSPSDLLVPAKAMNELAYIVSQF